MNASRVLRVECRRVELVELRESLESSCRFVVVSRVGSMSGARAEQLEACQSSTNKRRRYMSIGVQSRKLPVAPYSGCTCADSFASTYYVPVPPHTVVIVVTLYFVRTLYSIVPSDHHFVRCCIWYHHNTAIVDCSYFVRSTLALPLPPDHVSFALPLHC